MDQPIFHGAGLGQCGRGVMGENAPRLSLATGWQAVVMAPTGEFRPRFRPHQQGNSVDRRTAGQQIRVSEVRQIGHSYPYGRVERSE